jgi:hypothetical protein
MKNRLSQIIKVSSLGKEFQARFASAICSIVPPFLADSCLVGPSQLRTNGLQFKIPSTDSQVSLPLSTHLLNSQHTQRHQLQDQPSSISIPPNPQPPRFHSTPLLQIQWWTVDGQYMSKGSSCVDRGCKRCGSSRY